MNSRPSRSRPLIGTNVCSQPVRTENGDVKNYTVPSNRDTTAR